MKKQDLFWQTYLNLEKSLIDLSRIIYITDVKVTNQDGTEVEQPYSSQLETFSPYISDLLVQTCVQIEAVSKELYYNLGGAKPRGDSSIFFDEDCLKEIDIRWRTHEKVVLITGPFFHLTKDENRILKPLREAHKRQGTYWERAYQAVKHDRYLSMSMGNVKALLHAMAALYLLNIYYRNESWILSYNEISKIDVSLGSAVFCIQRPVAGQLWNDNTPVINESPYIVKYKDEHYMKIQAAKNAEEKALEDYWKSQPELNEPQFLRQLAEAAQESERVMGVWELGKYRLNKKISKDLPFEERRNLLINSSEWHGWIHQHNSHLKPDEITEDNIQSEINRVGIRSGMEIMKRYQKLSWINDAMNSEWCEVFIG